MSNKDVYCTLFISSNFQGLLPKDLLLEKAKSRITFTDNLSPERLEWRRRTVEAMASHGVSMPPMPDVRYWWDLSSKKVAGGDLDQHVRWILSSFRPGKFLKAELNGDYDYLLSVFWGASNGTGGGPVVSPTLAQTLVDHGIRMEIRFYVK